MADTHGPEPGTKARLIREGLERHPDLTPEELAEALNRAHKGLGIAFHAGEIDRARDILRETQTEPGEGAEGHHPLFTDQIPPVREHPRIQDTPPAAPEDRPG